MASVFLDVQSAKRHTIWDNSYPKNKNSDFKHRDYLSIYIALHLAVYVNVIIT